MLSQQSGRAAPVSRGGAQLLVTARERGGRGPESGGLTATLSHPSMKLTGGEGNDV